MRDVFVEAEIHAEVAKLDRAAATVAMPDVPSFQDIKAFEQRIRGSEFEIPEIPALHHFADGLYARELARPAGTWIVGKIHRKQHFYFLAKGEITAWTPGGKMRITAPCLMRTEPGTKRVTYAHTDAVSITFHATRETDLEKIEAELIIPDITELQAEAMAAVEMENPT